MAPAVPWPPGGNCGNFLVPRGTSCPVASQRALWELSQVPQGTSFLRLQRETSLGTEPVSPREVLCAGCQAFTVPACTGEESPFPHVGARGPLFRGTFRGLGFHVAHFGNPHLGSRGDGLGQRVRAACKGPGGSGGWAAGRRPDGPLSRRLERAAHRFLLAPVRRREGRHPAGHGAARAPEQRPQRGGGRHLRQVTARHVFRLPGWGGGAR